MKIGIYIDSEDLAIGIKEVLNINMIDADVIYNTINADMNSYDIIITSDDRVENVKISGDSKILLIANNINKQYVNCLLRPFTAAELIIKISELY